MPYATAADLDQYLSTDRYTDLVDRNRTGTTDDDAEAVASELSGASSLADSYIGRYLPIASAPLVLRERVMDIAVYRLAGNRHTDDERLRYEDAMRWLRDVAAGKASLALPEGGVEVPGGESSVCAPDAEFTFDQTRGIL